MVGAPRLWAHSGQCQPCSHTFQHVSQSKISCSRIWSSARVHPTSTHSQPAQNRSARLSQTGACKPSLCGCFASRTRSSTVRRAFPTARRVFASWGQEIKWSNVKVSSNEAAAQDLKKLVIDLGSLAEGYKTAGQFVQIKVGDSKAGFFAIASPPDSNNQGLVEVLIKDGPPDSTANLLCNISAGAEVSVSPVMGKGFRMERAPASDHPTCLLFATGSGISPIKMKAPASDGMMVAQEHGILVDPIYSLAAWEAATQALQIQQSRNSRVVMLHTGGALGLQAVAQRYPDWF